MPYHLRIADLMVLVALAAIGALTFRFDRDLFAVVAWACFLSCLSTWTLMAACGMGRAAWFGRGAALFGWTWLACGLRFGLLPSNDHLLLHTGVGLGTGLLSGYAAARSFDRPPPPKDGDDS
jgi:hypothetical protein